MGDHFLGVPGWAWRAAPTTSEATPPHQSLDLAAAG